MKNRKRMLSVLLALAVVFTMCITAAVAADKGSGSAATITVETVKKEVKVGDTVTLNVSIAGNPGFAAFDFTVKYDAGKLELTKAEKGNIEGSFTGNKDTGKVNLYVAADKKEYTEDGVLFSLTFNVKADCADGAQVTLNTTTFKNAQGDKLSPTIVAGGINATTGGSTTGGTGSTTGGTGSTGGGSTGGGSSSGSGSSYTSGMSFTTDLPADSITRVTVNGKKLDSKYYTVSSNGSGSIVTLTDAYLATLKAGTYTIKIESATHVSTGTFTIKADGTPKTADAGIALYAVMAVSSLMGTAVVSKKCRKA